MFIIKTLENKDKHILRCLFFLMYDFSTNLHSWAYVPGSEHPDSYQAASGVLTESPEEIR